LPGVLRDVDVNLAPLELGSRFNEAKSPIKWLEAALVATPTIASPTAPFTGAIEHGRTGWLADDPDAWRAAVTEALHDEDRRALVGARARRQALLEWSPHRQAERYLDHLDDLRRGLGAGRRAPSATWTPVAIDEPVAARPEPLEPYPPALAGSRRHRRRPVARPSVGVWLRQKGSRVRDTLEEGGLAGPVRGVGRWVARQRPGSRRGGGTS
jgi:hypothetical protein